MDKEMAEEAAASMNSRRLRDAAARRTAIRTKYRKNVKSGLWSYSDRYDAYYETKTRKWVEEPCGDSECTYCAKRPPLAPRKSVSPSPKGG